MTNRNFHVAAVTFLVVLLVATTSMFGLALHAAVSEQKANQHNCEVRSCRDGKVAKYFSGMCVCIEEPQ